MTAYIHTRNLRLLVQSICPAMSYPRSARLRTSWQRCLFVSGLLGLTFLYAAGLPFASPSSGKPVNCFGDSLTEGIYSAPWVEALERRLGRPCCNQGVNAESAASVARRAAVATLSDDAIVLAGTNDALLDLATRADNGAMASFYRVKNSIPPGYVPGPKSFAAAFGNLLLAVPARRIAVASLPPLGEANTGAAVDVIASYNAEIRDLVSADRRCIYVPFAEELASQMPLAEGGEAFDASRLGLGASIADMFFHSAANKLPFGPSFDVLAARRGRRVLHDNIHLTETSAALLLKLLVEALG